MTKIHHNTLKKAAAHGISLTHDGVDFVAGSEKTGPLAHGKDPRDVLDLAIAALNDGGDPVESTKPARAAKPKSAKKPRKPRADENDGEEGDEDEDKGASVVKDKYKKRYQPHKGTCGDDLVERIRAATTMVVLGKVQPGGKRSREESISVDLLEKLGKANNVWNPAWLKLRDRSGGVAVGMIRMNLGNRLRGMKRRKLEIKWPS